MPESSRIRLSLYSQCKILVFDRSAEFSDFLLMCLVKDPDQRSSASDLREVIQLFALIYGHFTYYYHCTGIKQSISTETESEVLVVARWMALIKYG